MNSMSTSFRHILDSVTVSWTTYFLTKTLLKHKHRGPLEERSPPVLREMWRRRMPRMWPSEVRGAAPAHVSETRDTVCQDGKWQRGQIRWRWQIFNSTSHLQWKRKFTNNSMVNLPVHGFKVGPSSTAALVRLETILRLWLGCDRSYRSAVQQRIWALFGYVIL